MFYSDHLLDRCGTWGSSRLASANVLMKSLTDSASRILFKSFIDSSFEPEPRPGKELCKVSIDFRGCISISQPLNQAGSCRFRSDRPPASSTYELVFSLATSSRTAG